MEAPMIVATEILINGDKRRLETDAARSLLSVLREDLDLTGSKYGCGEGRCGACTVLIDGKAVRSCVTLLGDCEGKQITTIEGLEQKGTLHPMQEAFLEFGAMQCGYCTAGMIMCGVSVLNKNPNPAPQEVSKLMEINICRCGTYPRIVQAVCKAGQVLKGVKT
jgi:aerobic-type carbon monoxide dehydrogenase small subunit (CoxS/CutS family)